MQLLHVSFCHHQWYYPPSSPVKWINHYTCEIYYDRFRYQTVPHGPGLIVHAELHFMHHGDYDFDNNVFQSGLHGLVVPNLLALLGSSAWSFWICQGCYYNNFVDSSWLYYSQH
jgi:hypothetical protein